MQKILHYLSGYVVVSIQGVQLERFLNLCRSRGILIHKLCRTGENEIQGILFLRDVWKLRPIRRKTRVHIRILDRCGLPFFFYRSKKRKAFFLGILMCFCLLFFLSARVWNIHIEGNILNPTPQILEFLGSEGVVHGMAKRKVNCSEIAAKVRKKYPEITWVSARLSGTKLILTIQEGILLQHTDQAVSVPCNLSADVNGTIVKMITRTGIPVMKTGDICKTGDILVRGQLDIRNDSQEVVRHEYVHADADIYVQHEVPYFHEFPMNYEKEAPAGRTKSSFYLKLGNWYFSIGDKPKDGWRTVTEEYPLYITENFRLPVSVGRISFQKYKKMDAVYTDIQAASIARERLRLYEEKLLKKGIQISENNVKIKVNHRVCTSSGRLTVIEKTGTETAIINQPEEREIT